jgi:predicted DsbA family dithiol-disulfide isomerase
VLLHLIGETARHAGHADIVRGSIDGATCRTLMGGSGGLAGAGLARLSGSYPGGRMEIQVWSDFACPWCALGFYRLDAALTRFEHGDAVEVAHRSYELDPHAPARRDLTSEQAVARKYGLGTEQVKAGQAQLTELGRQVGMVFRFDRVQLGNTFDAHRLAQAARGQDSEDALVKGLFAAYFTEGRLLSDHAVLAEVAASAGLEAGLTDKVLGGELYAREVRLDESAAYELEVTGVPYFLINGAWPIPGAQEVETLVTVLERAWARSAH